MTQNTYVPSLLQVNIRECPAHTLKSLHRGTCLSRARCVKDRTGTRVSLARVLRSSTACVYRTAAEQRFERAAGKSMISNGRAKSRRLLWLLAVALETVFPVAWALDNGVGRTPMMGWMAWIRFRCNIACDADPDNCISEHLVKSMADAMVAGGYKDAGYEYVSIDDCWQAHERAPDGTLQPNSTRFPSGMKALGDYIHARGLKFGMYTAMGKTTCQGYPALGVSSVDDMGYAKQDVETLVSWGIDYIKVDSCGGAQPSQFNTTHPLLSSWFLQAAQAAGRPVLYHPSGIALADGAVDRTDAGTSASDMIATRVKGVKQYRLFAKIANMWRTFADMQPIWSEVQAIIDYWAADDPETHPQMYPNEFADFLSASRPGAVQDPDALLVGNENNQPSCHPCLSRMPASGFCPARNGADPNVPCMCCGTLSLVEEQTNMVMWSMFAAPLEIAADIRHMPNASASILLNKEVIAVNQDSLVQQGRRVGNYGGVNVWKKELVDGSVAVAVYNSNNKTSDNFELKFETVGFSSVDRVRVRDLVHHRDTGIHIGSMVVAPLPTHGAALFNVSVVWAIA